MKLRAVRLVVTFVVGLLVAGCLATSANAVTPLISAFNEPFYSGHYWNPSVATVSTGGAVEFANPYASTYHGLKFTGGSAGEAPVCTGLPPGAEGPIGAFSWEGECKFTKPGTYTFVCTVHPLEMKGTITVTNGEPTVTTATASSVTEHEATLNGTVNPNGKSTKYHFQWGETTAYGNETTVPPAIGGSSDTQVSANLSGLIAGKLYHYRLLAENEGGPAEGADRTFTTLTPPGAPTATTSSASAVGELTATLNGTVNPNGLATEYWFEWGTTGAYGEETEPLSVTATDRASHPESLQLIGLLPGTVYHYRLVAKNTSGPSDGLDHEFKTTSPPEKEPPPSSPPTPTTIPPPTPTPLIAPPASSEEGFKLEPALLAGSAKLTAPRHSSTVHGSIEVGQAGAGGRLEVGLTTKNAYISKARGSGSKRVRIGRLVRQGVPAGKLSFSVPLTAQGKRALAHRHSLPLTVTIALTPSQGSASVVTRSITIRV